MRTRFPGLPLPLHREPAREAAVHDVEAIRLHPVTERSLPGSLPRPEPGSLSDQRQPAGIEPDVKMILGREGLVSLGIVGRKFERHDTESTAPFTFDNATPLLASLRASAQPPLPYASKRLLRPPRALRIGPRSAPEPRRAAISGADGLRGASETGGRSGGNGRRARARGQQLQVVPAGMKSLDPTPHLEEQDVQVQSEDPGCNWLGSSCPFTEGGSFRITAAMASAIASRASRSDSRK